MAGAEQQATPAAERAGENKWIVTKAIEKSCYLIRDITVGISKRIWAVLNLPFRSAVSETVEAGSKIKEITVHTARAVKEALHGLVWEPVKYPFEVTGRALKSTYKAVIKGETSEWLPSKTSGEGEGHEAPAHA